jgi:hypothetical protein
MSEVREKQGQNIIGKKGLFEVEERNKEQEKEEKKGEVIAEGSIKGGE